MPIDILLYNAKFHTHVSCTDDDMERGRETTKKL